MIVRLQSSARLPAALTIGVLLALACGESAQASDQSSAARIETLKQQLEELERKMTGEIAAVRQQIAVLEAQGQPAPALTAPAPSTQAPSAGETFARDAETVARVDNRPFDPALQGFLAIPGTPARVKVDGYAKLDAIVDTKPAGNTDRFVQHDSGRPLRRTADRELHDARSPDAHQRGLPQPDRAWERLSDVRRGRLLWSQRAGGPAHAPLLWPTR